MDKELLTMEHIYHIRYEYFDVGKSIRQIAKETGHDRATVKKYVEKENFNQSPTVKRTRSCRSDAYCEQIKKWLKEDEDAPRKQRHTARRVYQRLVEEASLKDQVFDTRPGARHRHVSTRAGARSGRLPSVGAARCVVRGIR